MRSSTSNVGERPLALGVVGVGRWGRHWARVCTELRGARLAALCDRAAARRSELPYACQEVPWFDEVDSLLRARVVDALIVATPTPLHASMALGALDAGCHVLVEKPLADNVEDAVRIGSHGGARAMVGHLLYYHPAILQIQQMVRAGELGTLTHVLSERLGGPARSREDSAWWALAPHDISVMRLLFGEEPRTVHCHSDSRPGERAEDSVTALLDFPGRGLGVVRVGGARPAKKVRRITVVGERRSVTFNDGHLRATLALYDSAPEQVTDRGPVSFVSGPVQKDTITGEEPLRVQGQHFVDCLASGEPFRSEANDGASVVRALDAGSRSLKEGRALPVEPEHLEIFA